MKIKDLLTALEKYDPEAEVMIPDMGYGGLMPVTHIAHFDGHTYIEESVFPHEEDPKEYIELYYHTGL